MASIIVPRSPVRRPVGTARIDWNNPITKGLAFFYEMGSNGAAVGFTAGNGRAVTPYVSGTEITTPAGRASQTASYLFETGATPMTGPNYSLFAFGNMTDVNALQNILDDDGAPRCFQLRIWTKKVQLITFDTSGAPYFATSTDLTDAQLLSGFTMGCSVAGNDLAAFKNLEKAVGTASGTQQVPTGNTRVGGYKGGGSAWSTGGVALVAGWTRPLSDAEQYAMARNPRQLILPPARRLWLVSAAAGAINLTAAPCTQDNTSSSGAVTQTQVLTGAGSVQSNNSSTGAGSQTHVLAGSPSSQANQCSTGAIGQTQQLAGAACAQANDSSSGAVVQTQVLTAAPSTQANESSTGVVDTSGQLVAAPCSQANASGTGAIVQVHQLSGSASTQANGSTGGAVLQSHVLAGAPCTQINLSSTGAIFGPPDPVIIPPENIVVLAPENRIAIIVPENRILTLP